MKLNFSISDEYGYETQKFLKGLLAELKKDPSVCKVDQKAFELLGDVHDAYETAKDTIASEGQVVLDRYGVKRPHPCIKIAHDKEVMLFKLLQEFGMTPKSRFKQGKKPKEKAVNPIDFLMKKPAKKVETR
ncbi:MAG TPA: P27 family phage terminase small subunit [Bacteroidales bacterium]|nr:P27 family phage terminase small subunit [Bacteroidales bacterium]